MKWLIRSYMCREHIESFSRLAELTGINKRTLFKRFDMPNTFRLYELKALDDVLKFSNEDLMALIRGTG